MTDNHVGEIFMAKKPSRKSNYIEYELNAINYKVGPDGRPEINPLTSSAIHNDTNEKAVAVIKALNGLYSSDPLITPFMKEAKRLAILSALKSDPSLKTRVDYILTSKNPALSLYAENMLRNTLPRELSRQQFDHFNKSQKTGLSRILSSIFKVKTSSATSLPYPSSTTPTARNSTATPPSHTMQRLNAADKAIERLQEQQKSLLAAQKQKNLPDEQKAILKTGLSETNNQLDDLKSLKDKFNKKENQLLSELQSLNIENSLFISSNPSPTSEQQANYSTQIIQFRASRTELTDAIFKNRKDYLDQTGDYETADKKLAKEAEAVFKDLMKYANEYDSRDQPRAGVTYSLWSDHYHSELKDKPNIEQIKQYIKDNKGISLTDPEPFFKDISIQNQRNAEQATVKLSDVLIEYSIDITQNRDSFLDRWKEIAEQLPYHVLQYMPDVFKTNLSEPDSGFNNNVEIYIQNDKQSAINLKNDLIDILFQFNPSNRDNVSELLQKWNETISDFQRNAPGAIQHLPDYLKTSVEKGDDGFGYNCYLIHKSNEIIIKLDTILNQYNPPPEPDVDTLDKLSSQWSAAIKEMDKFPDIINFLPDRVVNSIKESDSGFEANCITKRIALNVISTLDTIVTNANPSNPKLTEQKWDIVVNNLPNEVKDYLGELKVNLNRDEVLRKAFEAKRAAQPLPTQQPQSSADEQVNTSRHSLYSSDVTFADRHQQSARSKHELVQPGKGKSNIDTEPRSVASSTSKPRPKAGTGSDLLKSSSSSLSSSSNSVASTSSDSDVNATPSPHK